MRRRAVSSPVYARERISPGWICRTACTGWSPPAPKCFLGLRRPGTGRLGAYSYLPFGLGPFPGSDCSYVKGLVLLAARIRPSLRIIDFADSWRLAQEGGNRAQIFRNVARFLWMLTRSGARYHTKESGLWRPRELIPWLGFGADAQNARARIPEGMRKRGHDLSPRVTKLETKAHVSVREAPQAASLRCFRVAACVRRILPSVEWLEHRQQVGRDG